MTKTSMRIAVGKVVGLKCDDLTSAQMDDMGVPDYPDDLNAMHQVELYLQGDEWATYFSWIQYHGNATGTQSTAAQRCEGFLRAKGLLKGNMSDPLPPKTNVPIEDRLTERAAKGEFDPVRDCKHGHLARSCDLCELEELRIQSKQLREALLLYHEAWNGCERDWHSAMREASKNAEKVLWGKEKK